jgi:hypothetical protein
LSKPTLKPYINSAHDPTLSSINDEGRGSIVAKTSRIAIAIVFIIVGFCALSTSSCAIDDNYCPPGYCERAAFSSCEELSISKCETNQGCYVGLGCACAGATDMEPSPEGCDAIDCSSATSETSCQLSPGCKWANTCHSDVNCYELSEKECARYSTPCEFLTDPC